MKHTIAILGLITLLASANKLEAKAPSMRERAVFWSAQTGRVDVETIGGDTAAPWINPPPKELAIVVGDPKKMLLFQHLVRTHTMLPRATINDLRDGEFYALGRLQPTKYQIMPLGHPPKMRGLVTFKVGVFHLRCGAPTCNPPRSI